MKNTDAKSDRLMALAEEDRKPMYETILIWLLPVVLFLFALAVRLFYFHVSPLLERDGIYYIRALELLSAGIDENANGLANIPTFFLLCGHLLGKCGLSAKSALFSINIFCGTSLPVLFYFVIGYFISKKEIPFLIALALAAFPPLVKISTGLLREPLYYFLVLLASLLILYSFSAPRILHCLGGMLSSFFALGSCYVRTEGLVSFFLLSICWVGIHFYRKKLLTGVFIWIAGMAVMITLLFCFFLPYMLYKSFSLRFTWMLQH